MLTTETALGQMIFTTLAQAETFVAAMTEIADDGETFVVEPYQGGRFHVARYFKGAFESYC